MVSKGAKRTLVDKGKGPEPLDEIREWLDQGEKLRRKLTTDLAAAEMAVARLREALARLDASAPHRNRQTDANAVAVHALAAATRFDPSKLRVVEAGSQRMFIPFDPKPEPEDVAKSTIAELVRRAIREAEDGLAAGEIVAKIREWGRVIEARGIHTYLYRMRKRGVLRSRDGKYFINEHEHTTDSDKEDSMSE
jgi:hypothetical protein